MIWGASFFYKNKKLNKNPLRRVRIQISLAVLGISFTWPKFPIVFWSVTFAHAY